MGIDLIYPRDISERMYSITTEQKRALHAEWLAALRSGEYRQATGALQDDCTGGFCCLGVLCDVAMKRHPELGMRWGFENFTEADSCVKYAPPSPFTGALGNLGVCIAALAEMNDRDGKSFSEIADFIEAKISFAS